MPVGVKGVTSRVGHLSPSPLGSLILFDNTFCCLKFSECGYNYVPVGVKGVTSRVGHLSPSPTGTKNGILVYVLNILCLKPKCASGI